MEHGINSLFSQRDIFDPFWADTKLLIQAPVAGSSIVDAKGSALTPSGSVAISDQATGRQIYFDGTGDYISVGAAGCLDFLHNGQPWTIEFEMTPSTTDVDETIISTNGGSQNNLGLFLAFNAGKLQAFLSGTGSSFVIGASTPAARSYNYTFVAGLTYKVAIDFDTNRTSAHSRLYVNGKYVASLAKAAGTPGTANSSNRLIGLFDAGYPAYGFYGFMKYIRLTNAIRYGGDYIPPSWPLITR